jgi:hypothetical protein
VITASAELARRPSVGFTRQRMRASRR